MSEPAQDWQRLSLTNAMVLPRCLLNTMRLASSPAELASVLRLFFKFLTWRLGGSSAVERDETLRLQGATHVLGLGTGEMLVPQEIYWERGYDQVGDFVPQPGWIVLDVGANSGVYAVQQARRGARVYAFEPNPGCYRRLRKAVRANGLEDRVTAFNCALGASAGTAELVVPAALTTMGSLRPDWAPGASMVGVKVDVDTLDRVAGTLGLAHVDLLKIDVEGLEIDVIQGAREMLDLVDRVVIEYHSLELGRRVVELLGERGMTTVWDHRLYRGHESQYRGVGRGLLFSARQAGSSRGSGTGTGVA